MYSLKVLFNCIFCQCESLIKSNVVGPESCIKGYIFLKGYLVENQHVAF